MRALVWFLVPILAWASAAMADSKTAKKPNPKAEKVAVNPSVENYFRALDLNGDGFVSLAEAAGDPVVVQRFDKGDRNRDGKLSEKEFANLSKVKVRVAKARKEKDKEVSAAGGGSAPKAETRTAAERRRQRTMNEALAGSD
jgi:hypothetical protein